MCVYMSYIIFIKYITLMMHHLRRVVQKNHIRFNVHVHDEERMKRNNFSPCDLIYMCPYNRNTKIRKIYFVNLIFIPISKHTTKFIERI